MRRQCTILSMCPAWIMCPHWFPTYINPIAAVVPSCSQRRFYWIMGLFINNWDSFLFSDYNSKKHLSFALTLWIVYFLWFSLSIFITTPSRSKFWGNIELTLYVSLYMILFRSFIVSIWFIRCFWSKCFHAFIIITIKLRAVSGKVECYIYICCICLELQTTKHFIDLDKYIYQNSTSVLLFILILFVHPRLNKIWHNPVCSCRIYFPRSVKCGVDLDKNDRIGALWPTTDNR